MALRIYRHYTLSFLSLLFSLVHPFKSSWGDVAIGYIKSYHSMLSGHAFYVFYPTFLMCFSFQYNIRHLKKELGFMFNNAGCVEHFIEFAGLKNCCLCSGHT